MAPLKSDFDAYDQSGRAERILDYALTEKPLDEEALHTSEDELVTAATPNEVLVQDELRRPQLLEFQSDREHARVLIITSDLRLLEKETPERHEMIELGRQFDELHVCIMGPRVPRKAKRERVLDNVWFYPVGGRTRWTVYWHVYRTMERELVFGGRSGFRPDLVVGRDVFEAGFAAHFIARHYRRPLQVHILENVFSEYYQANDPRHKRHDRMLRFVLRRAKSVRVVSPRVEAIIKKRFKRVTDLAVLPHFYHVADIVQSVSEAPRTRRYPQFAFTFLFVGTLDATSTLYRTIDALRALLYTPSIGLVVIGDGPLRSQFEERARLLNVEKQIIFKKRVDDLMAELKGVDMLVCTDTETESDTVVIQAAAAGLPVMMSRNTFRDELFTDGVDAFLCDPNDTIEFSQKAHKFLNANALRTQFSSNIQDTVRNRIQESPERYYAAYRDSIEYVLTTVPLPKPASAPAPEVAEAPEAPATSTGDVPPPPTSRQIDGVEMKLPQHM